MKTKRYFKLILKPYRVILKHFDKDIRISIGKTFCCFPQLEEKGGRVTITLKTLKEAGYIDKHLENPKTGEEFLDSD